jgi:hypothetical protein
MNDRFETGPTDQGHNPTIQDYGNSTAIPVSSQYRGPPFLLSTKLFEVLSFIIITAVIGKLALYLVVATLLRFWLLELLESHNNDTDQRAASKRALLEEARKRRSQEVAIVAAAITKNAIGNILQVAGQEKQKLEAMRVEAKRRRSRDVATISSCIMKQVLRMQAEQKRKVERLKLELNQKPDLPESKAEKMVQACRQRITEPKHDGAISLPPEFAGYDPLGPDFTCIGTTQKGNRCRQWMISGSSKQAAANRLKVMRSDDPGNSFELAQLQELADWMLCPRWHLGKKPQGAEIARWWYKQLEPARAALLARRPITKSIMVTSRDHHQYFGFGSPAGSISSSVTSPFHSERSFHSKLGTPQSSPPSSLSSPGSTFHRTNREKSNWNSGDETWNGARNLTPIFKGLS